MPVEVVSTSRVLAVAVAAGLVAAGWNAARPVAVTAPIMPGAGLVVVADEDNLMPDVPWFARCHVASVTILVARGIDAQDAANDAHGVVFVEAAASLQSQLRGISGALASVDAARPSFGRLSEESSRVAALTRRELQVLDALMTGATAREIAAVIVVSLPTVRTHIRSILTKLGVSSQLAAAAVGCRVRCRPGSRRCEVHQF